MPVIAGLLRRLCPVCLRPDPFICRECWDALAWLPAGRADTIALWDYSGGARSVVLAAKNGNRRDLLRPLGRVLGARLGVAGLESVLVTWVPAHRESRRRRGYDQGASLAAGVADAVGGRHRRLLRRTGGRSQTGGTRAERASGPHLAPARGALLGPRRVAHSPLILVDDVITTGASLDAAGKAIDDELNGRVVARLALARVGDHHDQARFDRGGMVGANRPVPRAGP